ncbi:MAG: TM0106 family RecB-like putative nuclease [Burkholderiales bacterium]
MQRSDGTVLYSASDLVAFLGCEHSITLGLRNLDEPLPRAEDDASAKLVKDKGNAHEKAVLAKLEAQGLRVVEIEGHENPPLLAARTLEAMRDGADVIYQGAFLAGAHYGRTDFLRRVTGSSKLGDHRYEVLDTKLALSPKAKFAVQLAFYSDLLRQAQGAAPEHMHVILGDEREEKLRVADYEHYVDEIRSRFAAFVEAKPATQPEKCAACEQCAWREICAAQWKAEDHLNQVANIRRVEIHKLNAAGIRTMAQLADMRDASVPGMSKDTAARLVAQATLQCARREQGAKPKVELLPPDPEGRRGFHRIPRPDRGDLFFDMEGDPFEPGGLEYLFGVQYDDGDGPQFRAFWAHDRQEERRAFEQFVDFVVERVARYPDLHVYHYNHYEPTALKRLMTQHGTRGVEVDDLLRAGKFVDLYTVVRQAMRTSESGLSIKDLEVFYMPPREGDIQDAGASIVSYEKWKVSRQQAELDRIAAYNADDCRSTHLLREWLLSLRPEGMPWFEAGRAKDGEKQEKSDKVKEIEAALEAYRARLGVADVPVKEDDRTPEERLSALLFALLDFHRREAKPGQWAVYARTEMTVEDLVADVECIGGLRRTATPRVDRKRSWIYEYAFEVQETKFREGKKCLRCDDTSALGSIHEIDAPRGRVTILMGPSKQAPDACSIGPDWPIDSTALRKAVWRFADAFIADDGRFGAGRAFLHRRPPAFKGRAPGTPVVEGREEIFDEAYRAVTALDDSYLFIQGPPGSGKTTVGSQLIVALIRAGKRVGVTSNSHKVIHNLLDAVEECAQEQGFAFKGLKKSGSDEDSSYTSAHIETVDHNKHVVAGDAQLVAGTAWLFSDPGLESRIDYLFVDEAGQVSLANLMAVSTSARNLVLLGDHMQLGQPIQGTHPDGAGMSALGYLLDGDATVPADRGIFLPKSYRMHHDVCRFISNAVYDGRLEADPRNQVRKLVLDGNAHPLLRPSGIRFHPVEHTGCAQSCSAEAKVLKALYANLRTQRWVDKDGTGHPIAAADILVVAPYNAQVNLLREVLPEGARIGTIDKFQGQEAPVVLVSMTSSSGEDLPRGIEFLFEKNRLNVAVSRAKCLAVVVASPLLLHVDCGTPEQMALVNMLCWLRDHAEGMATAP